MKFKPNDKIVIDKVGWQDPIGTILTIEAIGNILTENAYSFKEGGWCSVENTDKDCRLATKTELLLYA